MGLQRAGVVLPRLHFLLLLIATLCVLGKEPAEPAENTTKFWPSLNTFANVSVVPSGSMKLQHPSGVNVRFFNQHYNTYMVFTDTRDCGYKPGGNQVITDQEADLPRFDVIGVDLQEVGDGTYRICNKLVDEDNIWCLFANDEWNYERCDLTNNKQEDIEDQDGSNWQFYTSDDCPDGQMKIYSASHKSFVDAQSNGGIWHTSNPQDHLDSCWQLQGVDPPLPPCTATNVTGQWEFQQTLVGAVVVKLTEGTQKKYSQSKTSGWSNSVTTQVKQAWEFFGEEGSITVTGQMASSTSETYSNEWSTSTTQEVDHNFDDKYSGRALWQFVFHTTDTCGHTETTMNINFAVTNSRAQPPCCVPGYNGAQDVSYQTCVTQHAMIPG